MRSLICKLQISNALTAVKPDHVINEGFTPCALCKPGPSNRSKSMTAFKTIKNTKMKNHIDFLPFLFRDSRHIFVESSGFDSQGQHVSHLTKNFRYEFRNDQS